MQDLYSMHLIRRYRSHFPIRRIRRLGTLPAPTLVNAHPNFKLPRTMSLDEHQFRLVLNIQLPQHEPCVPRGRQNLSLTG
jgi:hypothetical protein